jgi:protein-S-isoprenylcysteine O-methyltransferase Ste14
MHAHDHERAPSSQVHRWAARLSSADAGADGRAWWNPRPKEPSMNHWIARAAVLAAAVVMIAIRAPHGQRSRSVPVVRSAGGRREVVLLAVAWIGFFVPLLWIFTPWLSFADHRLHPVPFGAGLALLAAGLWLFHRSHADLGRNWSITLQVREEHRLVTDGVYARVRHPMYLALLLYSVGQWLVLPNWVAGPAYLVAFGILFAFRVVPEERMMEETFGAAYVDYARTTKRLVPGVW